MSEIDPTTFKPTEDGAYTISIDKKPVRLVEERHLLAIKGSSETKANEWNTERTSLQAKLEESNKAHETTRQQVLQEQAAKEQLMEKYKDHDTLLTKVGELDKELSTQKTLLQQHQEELAIRLKAGLLSYGASEESLKERTLDQLRNLEDAAKLLGKNFQKSATYDGGTGGGGSAPETPTERARRILDTHDQSKNRILPQAAKV